MHEFETLQGFLEHVSLVMDVDTADGERARLADDAARRQGPGVRRGVPAGLGGGPVPAPAQPRRERPGRARGGAPAGLRRPDARQAPGQGQLRPEPAQPRPVAGGGALALRRRAARGATSRSIEPKSPYGGGTAAAAASIPTGRSRFDEPAAGFASGYTTPGWQRAKEQWSREDRGKPRAPADAGGRAGRLLDRPHSGYAPASACSTRSSATARWPRSTATSSPSISTRPAASAWSTASSPAPTRRLTNARAAADARALSRQGRLKALEQRP